MTGVSLPLQQRTFGETTRRDRWWVTPILVFFGLSTFVVYATWAAFQGEHYTHGPYLSPFYAPELFGYSPHAWFGPPPAWWPGWLPFSPALLILWAPGGFRVTCYYYRGAYYKAFWADPPSCAVGEPRKGYIGESNWPLIIQNVHRYFLYLALIFIMLLAWDALKAFWYDGRFFLGVGTIVLCVNVVLLAGYTFGCHSLRHIVGGRLDCISQSPLCHKAYACSSALNRRHMLWAWMSLFSVMFADVYVRMCSMGYWRDLRIIQGTRHMDYRTHEYDVLVIGAGGAGLRAAIEASAAGVSVGLVCKSLLGKAHTVMAEGGIAAALANVDERDNWRVHFADTMRGGQYVNNWRMAQIHAQEAPARVRELEAWGAVFDRTKDGRILQRNFGGHKYPRLAHVGDRTGLEMIRTLQDHGIHRGINVHMECTVTRLLLDAGRVVGAFGYERERGRFVVFRAKAVVLATGGIGRAFKITSNSWEYTGDGHTLAYDAGAELIDMEFVQFHPTGMIWPPSVRGILVTEGVRGEGGVLRNNTGARFMFGDIPDSYKPQTAENEEEGFLYVLGEKYQGKDSRRLPELLTRDHVARCIVREVKEGRGSPHGGVFLELQTFAEWYTKRSSGFNAAEHWKKKLPSMYHQFKELGGLDITKEQMEVGPTTHYVMGGVRVDSDSQMSRVPGLFACGECAAGINGANRLGGNSLSDIIVLGKRAGEFAAKYSKDTSIGPLATDQVEAAARWALEPFERTGNEGPFKIQEDLQDMMQELVGIVRREDEMLRALDGLAALRQRSAKAVAPGNREYNPGWHTALELHSLLTVSEAVTKAALVRKESRGAQFRDDYPKKDNGNFGKVNTITWRASDGKMQVRLEQIAPMPEDLRDAVRAENGGALPDELK